MPLTEAQVEQVFAEIDFDGSGGIQRDECAKAIRFLLREVLAHVEESHFLDPEPLMEMRERLFNVGYINFVVDQVFLQFDVPEDGGLSLSNLQEFVSGMQHLRD